MVLEAVSFVVGVTHVHVQRPFLRGTLLEVDSANTICVIFGLQVEPVTFTLYPLPCPAGYALLSTARRGLECQCEDNNNLIINCEDDQDSVIVEVQLCIATKCHSCMCSRLILVEVFVSAMCRPFLRG